MNKSDQSYSMLVIFADFYDPGLLAHVLTGEQDKGQWKQSYH